MYPTRLQVKSRYQQIADDWPQTVTSVFTEEVFAPAFDEAYEVMYNAMLKAQVPRIELMVPWVVPPFITELTPEDIGIPDFGDFIFVRERIAGSSEKFRQLNSVDVLPQRQPQEYLRVFNWRNNTFYFVGATSTLELQFKFDSSSCPPTNDDAVIGVDSCINFLANYAFGVSGGRKGYREEAVRCMSLAVGSGYTAGVPGGQLADLMGPLVRSRQKVQIAHRPYQSGWGRGWRGWGGTSYVGPSQQGTTGGGSQNTPIQFSSVNGDIIGVIDGVNAVFVLSVGGVTQMSVYLNGVLQTEGSNYSRVNNMIQFMSGSIPQPGTPPGPGDPGSRPDIITVDAWLSYNLPNVSVVQP